MANLQISQLPTKPIPVASTDQFGIDDNDAKSWKITVAALETYFDNVYVNLSGGSMTGPLVLYGDPSFPFEAATKQYVDDQILSCQDRFVAEVATTGNLTATYSNGTAGVGRTLTNADVQAPLQIDNEVLAVGDIVLVKDQNNPYENGPYRVTNEGTGATNWVLTGIEVADVADELIAGSMVTVLEGQINSKTQWIQTTRVVTIGVDPVVYESNIVAGTGLTKTNNTLSITAPIPLDLGGTGAILTGSVGGIPYSTASEFAILAGTNAAGRMLQSGNLAAPSWSTPTYPSTSGSAGKMIISDGTNNIYSTPTYPNTAGTAGSMIISDGTNKINSTSLWPNTVGTAGKLLMSDGTSNVYSTPSFPTTAGTAGSIVISDGTNKINSTSLWPNTVGGSGTLLRSNGTSNGYSTATFADTYAANTVLAATTSNTVAGLASSANTVLLANAAGIISFAALSSPAIVSYANPNGSNSTGNGTWNYQYADPFAASNNNTGTATIPRMVYANMGSYSTTSFSVKPNVWLVGVVNTISNASTGNVWNVNNPITLDASWSSAAADSALIVKSIKFSSTTYFDLNFSTASAPNASDLIIEDCAMLAMVVTGGASRIPNFYFLDSEDLGSGLTITQANAIIEKSKLTSIGVLNTASAGATSFFMQNSYVSSGMSLQGNTSAALTGNIRASAIAGALTLLGTNVTVTVDQASYPGAGIVFSAGALQSQVTIPGITPVAQNSSSNLTAWNLATAPNAKQTMTENTTLSNPTNQIEGMTYSFVFTQSATPRTLAFGTAYDFGGVTPVISTVNGSENIFYFRSNGTDMKCVGQTLGV